MILLTRWLGIVSYFHNVKLYGCVNTCVQKYNALTQVDVYSFHLCLSNISIFTTSSSKQGRFLICIRMSL